MKIYHGSPSGDLNALERRQSNTGNDLPEQETRDAIYLTTDLGFALLAGGRPRGEGGGVYKPENGSENQMAFRDPSKFDQNKEVFIYEWDIEELPEGSYEMFGHQVIVNLSELKTHEPTVYPAEKVFEYYDFTNWPPPPKEHVGEMKFS
jgi:hypothetical protein